MSEIPDGPYLVRLDSVRWAMGVALVVERKLRMTDDPEQQRRLRAARDWHFASLRDDQLKTSWPYEESAA